MLCGVGSSKPTFLARRWEPQHPQALGLPLFHLRHSLCRAGLRLLADAPALAAPSFFLPDGGSGSATSASSMSGGTVDLLLSPARQPRVSISLPETEARGPSLTIATCNSLPLSGICCCAGWSADQHLPQPAVERPESPPCGGSGFLTSASFLFLVRELRRGNLSSGTFFRGRLQSPRSPCQAAGLPLQLIAQGRRLGGLVIRTELP